MSQERDVLLFKYVAVSELPFLRASFRSRIDRTACERAREERER